LLLPGRYLRIAPRRPMLLVARRRQGLKVGDSSVMGAGGRRRGMPSTGGANDGRGLLGAGCGRPGRGSRVTAQGMAGGDLDENNLYPVGVLDPHLDQSPGLGLGLLEYTDTGGGQPLMLGVDIADLDPDDQRPSGTAGTTAGNLQEPRAEEEHHPRIGRGSELPVDRQAPARRGRNAGSDRGRWPATGFGCSRPPRYDPDSSL
jgi:hypothetical protein